MGRVLRRDTPIWINRINRKMGIRKFRQCIETFKSIGQDISRACRANSCKDVYEVIVETWSCGEKTIWVHEDYVEVTGPIYTRFLETMVLEDDDDDDLEINSTLINEGTSSIRNFMNDGEEEVSVDSDISSFLDDEEETMVATN